jgi:hypothetical protein
MGHEETKPIEHQLDSAAKPAEKVASEPITKAQDNAIQRRAEQLLAAKSFRLTGDNQLPFELKTEDGLLISRNKSVGGDIPSTAATGNSVQAEIPVTAAEKISIAPTFVADFIAQANPFDKLQNLQVAFDDKTQLPESLLKIVYGDRAEHGHQKNESRVDKSMHKLEDDAKKLLKDHKISQSDYEHMTKDIEHLRERVRKNQVDANEAAKVYEQMDKLINVPNGAISEDKRILLGENVLYHAAWPHKIDQGKYNTCNASAIQEHLFTHQPAKAAEIAVSVALYGGFESGTGPDRKWINIDADSLVPSSESAKSHPDPGDRSYATQVLNLAIANDIVQRENPPHFYHQIPEGNVSFPGHPGDATHRTNADDNGERLVNEDGSEATLPGKPSPEHSPGYAGHADQLASELKRLTGESGVVIANEQIPHSQSADIVHIHSAADLDKVLKHHKMPMMLAIDAIHPPWSAGFSVGHVITITGYDPVNHRVTVSDTHDPKFDTTLPLDVVYQASTHHKRPAPPPASLAPPPHN